MMRMLGSGRVFGIGLLGAILALLGANPDAHAISALELSGYGGPTITIHDNGLGDTNAAAGVVQFSGALGAFNVSISIGVSQPVLGSPTIPNMHLTSLQVSSQSAGSITIKYSDNGFLGAGLNTVFNSAVGGVSTGTVAYTSWGSNGTQLFDTNPLDSSVLFASGPMTGAFSDSGQSASYFLPTGFQYTLTQIITIDHSGWGATSVDATLRVPEPGTVLLLGVGMLILGIWGFCRKAVLVQ